MIDQVESHELSGWTVARNAGQIKTGGVSRYGQRANHNQLFRRAPGLGQETKHAGRPTLREKYAKKNGPPWVTDFFTGNLGMIGV